MSYAKIEIENIYTVSRLNNEVKCLLEEGFSQLWVEGEISNFAQPHSGHWYFSLKDSGAQVRCAMFRGAKRNLDFMPKDGMHVLVRARVSLYENRGEYQLIVETMEERGEGKLRRAFEMLKKKLSAAGLFDDKHKKKLPLFPRTIGLVTSATGAAIADLLTVLKRRYPCAAIILYPTLVQGMQAAANIVEALQIANRRKECDVLILARGGGSLEDLWPFNEESVAYAIHHSELPIISAIGHEIDFTIADFVADVRAPTPSAAAEIVTPDKNELSQTLLHFDQQLKRKMHARLNECLQQLQWMEKHLALKHPKRQLLEKMQRLDVCELSLIKHLQNRIHVERGKCHDLSVRLFRLTPKTDIQNLQFALQTDYQQIKNLIERKITQARTQLAQGAATLDAFSPLATLQRGYALAIDHHGKIIRKAKQLKMGDALQVKLAEGDLDCEVKDVR